MKSSKIIGVVTAVSLTANILLGTALFAGASEKNARELRECLKKGLCNFDESINILQYGYTSSEEDLKEIKKIVSEILEDPDMFHVELRDYVFDTIHEFTGRDVISSMSEIHYDNIDDKEEALKYREEFDLKSQEIIDSVITPEMTDIEKALKLHDYIALNSTYDIDGCKPDLNDGYSAYDILISGNGVCQGYALAYQHLLGLAGIESKVVKSFDMHHGWNLVRIGENWYHVDVTWDDPVPDAPGKVEHTFFMLSDEAISQKRNGADAHYKWNNGGITASDTSYDDMFWKNVSYEIFVLGDKWYYINPENGVYTTYFRDEDRTDETVWLFENPWYVWGEQDTSKRNYGYSYSSIIVSGDTMYFNTPTQLYSMHLDGSEKHSVGNYINYQELGGYCYGLVYQDDAIYGVIKKSPEEEGTLEKLYDVHFDIYSYIDRMLSTIRDLGDGETANFNLSTEKFLPAQAVDSIKDRNVSLSLECDNSIWEINGQDVSSPQLCDVDLSVGTNQGIIPSDSFENQAYIEFNLPENNDLSFTGNVKCKISEKYAGQKVEIYVYDRELANMQRVDSAFINPRGWVTLPLGSSTDYAVVLDGAGSSQSGAIEIGKGTTGDLDNNDIVDITDLTKLSLYLLGDIELENTDLADVTGDGEVNIADLALMKQYVMHVISEFPSKQ